MNGSARRDGSRVHDFNVEANEGIAGSRHTDVCSAMSRGRSHETMLSDMRVRDAMTPDAATCEPTTTLRLVATLMLDHDCAAVPIVSSGEVLGIVTDRDIACRAVARGWNAAELPASAVMSSPLVAVHPDETFDDAVQVMKENHVHHLPVIDDDGRLLGIVAQSDLGRRMSNRELGQLARETSIRGLDRGESELVRVD